MSNETNPATPFAVIFDQTEKRRVVTVVEGKTIDDAKQKAIDTASDHATTKERTQILLVPFAKIDPPERPAAKLQEMFSDK